MKFAVRIPKLFAPFSLFAALSLLVACASPAGSAPSSSQGAPGLPKVLAAETFLADIAQNVAGDRLHVDALIPIGVDTHAFEPTPQDVRKVAESTLLIINGAGLETFLNQLLSNAGGTANGQRTVLEAAKGLPSRNPQPGEHPANETDPSHAAGDPHFWLDPTKVVTYVQNIRDALITADPAGKDAYTANAQAYTAKLNDLDAWIKQQVGQVPEARRLLVTNHESFGYFADRYGFKVVGALIPSVSTEASPSAQELARLADQVKATGAPAVFLETGSNTQLADQLARETGIKVVTGLLTHSITASDGPAPDYISMMRYNVNAIVGALR